MACDDKEKGSVTEFVFRTMGDFINHVLTPRAEFKKIVGLSHNGSRFDTLSAKNVLEEQEIRDLRILCQGQEII